MSIEKPRWPELVEDYLIWLKEKITPDKLTQKLEETLNKRYQNKIEKYDAFVKVMNEIIRFQSANNWNERILTALLNQINKIRENNKLTDEYDAELEFRADTLSMYA